MFMYSYLPAFRFDYFLLPDVSATLPLLNATEGQGMSDGLSGFAPETCLMRFPHARACCYSLT